MRKSSDVPSSKLERKLVERKRRMYMKGLCFKLASLIPAHHFGSSKHLRSELERLDHAAKYIQQLQERLEKLKQKKETLAMGSAGGNKSNFRNNMTIGFRQPVLELRDLGSDLELILITGLNKNFMLHDVISIFEEEGAGVVNASFSVMGDKVYHSIHAKVTSPRIGVETSRVCERLNELIY